MTLALHSPKLVSSVVAVDNCPVNLPVASDFLKYLEGMAEAEQQQVRTHAEADEVLRQFDLVSLWLIMSWWNPELTEPCRIHRCDSGY